MKVLEMVVERADGDEKQRKRKYPASAWLEAIRMFMLNAIAGGTPQLHFIGDGEQKLTLLRWTRTGSQQGKLVYMYYGTREDQLPPEGLPNSAIVSEYVGNIELVEHGLLRFALSTKIKLFMLGFGDRGSRGPTNLFIWKTEDGGIELATSGDVSEDRIKAIYAKPG